MTATASPDLPGWGAAAMILSLGAYALGFVLRARRVVTAAEARQRRQEAQDQKRFKRICKRHRALMDAVIANDGALELELFGATLHMRDEPGRLEAEKSEAKRLRDWRAYWDDVTASYVPRQRGVKTGIGRSRRGKYPGPGPARYGSSKRGKVERPWVNQYVWNDDFRFTPEDQERARQRVLNLESEL